MPDTASWEIATTTAGIADRSDRGTVVAVGTEIVPLLQGVVTSDVFALAEEGSGQVSAATNAVGRLVCDLRLLHVPDLLIMDFEPGMLADGVLSHFRANVMMEDAKFVDRTTATARWCAVGPDAATAVAKAARLTQPLDALAPYDGTWGDIDGHDVIVWRIPTYGMPAYDILHATEAHAAVREALSLPTVDAATLETLRIEAGVARWGAELDPKIIPLEAGLDEAVAYDKGCYVGQEIIARLDTLGQPAKLLRKLVFDGRFDEVGSGAKLTRDGKGAGEVRSIAWSPRRETTIALAYVKRGHYEVGTVVEVDGHPATVEPLTPE